MAAAMQTAALMWSVCGREGQLVLAVSLRGLCGY